MKKTLIIIIAIIVFALSVTVGFFVAEHNDNPPVETLETSTDTSEIKQEETFVESETISETETETESQTETTVLTTEAQKAETINTDYYSLSVPASWQGKYTYKVTNIEGNGGYGLSVCHKASYGVGYGGKLFTICLYSVEEGTGKELIEIAPVPVEYLGVLKVPGVGDFDVIVMFPSDAQFNATTMDSYNELFNSKDSVFKTFTATNGATFEKAE